MNDHHESFWPADLPDPSDPPPVALLKEQGELLGDKTNGEILGVVRMIIENRTVYHTLFLKANLIGDLMVAVLTISYPAFESPQDVYPITADASGDGDRQSQKVTLANHEEFRNWLRDQLSSDHVRSVIGVLKAYIREIRESRASWAG